MNTARGSKVIHNYLSSLREGKPYTPRSWLYEDKDPKWILDRVLGICASLERGTHPEQLCYQRELSQVTKYGPQGGVEPWSEVKQLYLDSFESKQTPTFGSDWSAMMTRVKEELGLNSQRLRARDYSAVVESMRARDTLESNSGFPDFGRRSRPEIKERAIRDARSGEYRMYPALPLFRNYNQKTRAVWMFPMSTNLVEGSYQQVLYDYLNNKALELLAPWKGFHAVQQVVTQAYDAGLFLTASDFSAADEHFRTAQLEVVAEMVSSAFQVQDQDGCEESILEVATIPVLTPDGIVTGTHGVASGSNWTNFVETMFDIVFLRMLVPRGYAIGDDIAFISERYADDLPEKIEKLAEQYGLVANQDKVTNEPDWVVSLQRLFVRGYKNESGLIRGIYPLVRAIKSAVYPERFHRPETWSSDMFCARQYMVYENCVDHPKFEEFVRFCVAGQRDLIPFASKSKSELQAITRMAKDVPGLVSTYTAEKRDQGLASFKSIEIAANM